MIKSKLNDKNIKYVFEICEDLSDTKENIEIKTVLSKKDFKDFYDIPFKIYEKDKNWIPPLWSEIEQFLKLDNTFWKHTKLILFKAKKNGKNAGRIAGFIDEKYCESVKKKIGFFGLLGILFRCLWIF